MAIRLEKTFLPLDADHLHRVKGQLGVYELADNDGQTLFIGFAGGRSPFGLRGELDGQLERRGPGLRFRAEVNMQYTSRYRELLMAYVSDHGELPPDNQQDPTLHKLGRL